MAGRRFSIIRTAVLPGIAPRLGALLLSGFAPLTQAMALAFAALGLLPRNHPYLLSANYGRFSARAVLVEARRHLVVDRAHADQVILYYTLLLGFFAVIAEAIVGIVLLVTRHAQAATSDPGATYKSFFVTPDPQNDLAFNILDLMFGFKGIFDSNALSKVTQMQTALQALFHFYNVGILAIAVIVVLYLVMNLVVETAETGVPFGRRFNGAWGPLRLVFAVGLLTPLTFGMNGGQLLTMYVAKWGSSLATNGWITFLDNLHGATQLGDASSLVIDPGAPDVRGMTEALFVAKTCAHYQCLMNGKAIQGYVINGQNSCPYLKTTGDCQVVEESQTLQNGNTAFNPAAQSGADSTVHDCDTVTVKTPPASGGGTGTGAINAGSTTQVSNVDSFDQAQKYSDHQSIYIRFGEKTQEYSDQAGYVSPICGDMTFEIKDTAQPGADYMQRQWYDLLNQLWKRSDFDTTALNIAKSYVRNTSHDPTVQVPSTGRTVQDFVAGIQTYTQTYEANAVKQARQAQMSQNTWDEDFTKYGWLGAGMWYNKLAEVNGALMSSVGNPPHGGKYPAVLENVAEQQQQSSPSMDPAERYRPYRGGNTPIEFRSPEDRYEAMADYEAQQMFQSGYKSTRNNGVIDMISAIFGTGNMFSMQQNIKDGINPLVQLIGLGRGLFEASVRNMGIAMGGAIIGGIGNIIGAVPVGIAGQAISGMASKIGVIGLAAGIALFYVIPFLPFIYFFFAAATWFKSIFVALTSIPLWAIALLRTDGEGLYAQKSLFQGVILLFEIFLRPILMIFGLIGGLSIFAAQASILAEIWDLVTVNLAGFDTANATSAANTAGVNYGTTLGVSLTSTNGLRGIIDQFMMTVIFTVVIYMMAVSSFKLTDAIPDSILRWMASSGFGSFDPNPAEGLMSNLSRSAMMLIDPRRGALASLISRN